MKRSDFEKDRFAGINWPKYDEGDQDYLQIGMMMGIFFFGGGDMPAFYSRNFICTGTFCAKLISHMAKKIIEIQGGNYKDMKLTK